MPDKLVIAHCVRHSIVSKNCKEAAWSPSSQADALKYVHFVFSDAARSFSTLGIMGVADYGHSRLCRYYKDV